MSCYARQKSKKHSNLDLMTQGQEVKHSQKGQRNKKEKKVVIRYSFFWLITHHTFSVVYERFGTAYKFSSTA